MGEDRETSGLSNVVRIYEHLGQIVCGTVEDTLNGLLEAEAERLVIREIRQRTRVC